VTGSAVDIGITALLCVTSSMCSLRTPDDSPFDSANSPVALSGAGVMGNDIATLIGNEALKYGVADQLSITKISKSVLRAQTDYAHSAAFSKGFYQGT